MIYGQFSSEQRKALESFEGVCGLEPLYQDAFNDGEISFEELWHANVRHLEDIVAEASSIKIPSTED
jgi:hypothetical protein